MHLEIVTMSEVSRERQMLHDITYLWNRKRNEQVNLFTKQKQAFSPGNWHI